MAEGHCRSLEIGGIVGLEAVKVLVRLDETEESIDESSSEVGDAESAVEGEIEGDRILVRELGDDDEEAAFVGEDTTTADEDAATLDVLATELRVLTREAGRVARTAAFMLPS